MIYRAIEVKRLAPEEFGQLATVGDGATPDPKRSVAIVAHNTEKIIGRIFLVAPAHVEGIFIEEAWRGKQLFARLVNAMEIEARAEGIAKLYAYAVDNQMQDYILRSGYKKLPWTVFEKELSCR